MKLEYSSLTSSFVQCCNKGVIIYSGASVWEFVRAIRSIYKYKLMSNRLWE